MYFVVMGSDAGPAGVTEFFADRRVAAARAVDLVHSEECPVPGMVVVGEGDAATEADLEALPEGGLTVHGALVRQDTTTIVAGNCPGWMWAPMISYKGGFPGHTSPKAAPAADIDL